MRLRPPIPRLKRPPRGRPGLTGAACAVAALAILGGAWRVLVAQREYRLADRPAIAARLVRPAPRPTTRVSFDDGCASAECHPSMTQGPGVHAPDGAGACDACHAPDTGGHVYPARAARGELCQTCHDTARDALVQHSALTVDGCLACHDPHAYENPSLLKGAEVGALCAECHAPALGASAHPPYESGECGACHDPHGADGPALLHAGAPAETCVLCHTDTLAWMTAARHSHLAIEGSCLACHGAHRTAHEPLMAAGTQETCTRCHAEVGRLASTAMVTHDAVISGERCLTCHAPHASDQARMLRADQRDVCMGCHAEAQTGREGRVIPAMDDIAASGGQHGPVSAGNCAACHSVHGAEHQRLLRHLNPAVLAGQFDMRNYALCFNCHDQALALEDTPEATQFREGERNLHRVHAGPGGRARGCADCHAIHGSHQPRLIAERVSYEGSGWVMEMGFSLTPDGGSCSPGCHEPLGYSRAARPETPHTEGGAP